MVASEHTANEHVHGSHGSAFLKSSPTTRPLSVTYSKLHKAFLCTMKLQFIALVMLAVANPSLANEMRGSKMHQQEDHCVPEGVFTCTAVATIYNVAEAKFVNGEVMTGESTYHRTLEDGTPLARGHYLLEHPSFYFPVQGEMSACALNPVIEGATKCADVSDSTIYESKLNKDCTALKGIAYQTATATLFNELPVVSTYSCEKKKM